LDELTPQSAVPYLTGRGLLDPGNRADVDLLGGGVSCVVIAVVSESGARFVVKQARAQLRVAEQWLASPDRAETEADALQVAATIVPGAVPAVRDVDPAAHTLVLEYAPVGWASWKDLLLRGDVDSQVARWLGDTLARIHSHTAADPTIPERFDHADAFEQLRVGPYYRRTAEQLPELADAIGERIERLEDRRSCLVHGDFSPKNVLVGGGGRWVIDFEVAHFGSPVFDVGFMVNHLLLKAIHRPQLGVEYGRCVSAFWEAYAAAVTPRLMQPADEILKEVGCLMLSRVEGKSPAEYLDDGQRDTARALGRRLLLDPPSELGPVLSEVAQERVG
jgi:tRNA A-37 threonylcarbamoyl transferase component Bud32